MRPVKLITGVNVETVMCDRMDSLQVMSFNPRSSPCYGSREVLDTLHKMHVVPIKHWIKQHYKHDHQHIPQYLQEPIVEEDYIAVSPELDETLGKYIKLISSEANEKVEEANCKRDYYWQENDRLRWCIESFDKATFWKRLKYLFTGRMKIE